MSSKKYADKLEKAASLIREIINEVGLTREQRKKMYRAWNAIRRAANVMSREDWIRATVGLIRKGHNGRFAEAFTEELEPAFPGEKEGKTKVTFSVEGEDDVWEEDRDPQSGEIVLLSDITAKDRGGSTIGGWRAHHAQLLRPARRR